MIPMRWPIAISAMFVLLAALAPATASAASRPVPSLELVARQTDPPVLREGDTGPWVQILQVALNALCNCHLEEDSIFGENVRSAVEWLQWMSAESGAETAIDGVVGKETWALRGVTSNSASGPAIRAATPPTTPSIRSVEGPTVQTWIENELSIGNDLSTQGSALFQFSVNSSGAIARSALVTDQNAADGDGIYIRYRAVSPHDPSKASKTVSSGVTQSSHQFAGMWPASEFTGWSANRNRTVDVSIEVQICVDEGIFEGPDNCGGGFLDVGTLTVPTPPQRDAPFRPASQALCGDGGVGIDGLSGSYGVCAAFDGIQAATLETVTIGASPLISGMPSARISATAGFMVTNATDVAQLGGESLCIAVEGTYGVGVRGVFCRATDPGSDIWTFYGGGTLGGAFGGEVVVAETTVDIATPERHGALEDAACFRIPGVEVLTTLSDACGGTSVIDSVNVFFLELLG